jgi:pyruvate,water dikinase
MNWIRRFDEVASGDIPLVGGKNASLAELARLGARKGFSVPAGFALTTDAFHRYVEVNGLEPVIRTSLDAYRSGRRPLEEAGLTIRSAFKKGAWPKEIAAALEAAWKDLDPRGREPLAVRSSATAEDLPGASFAGLHETYLNVIGLNALLDACRNSLASLYTDRAILYREEKGFVDGRIGLSVGIQQMVSADKGASGVMFTLDTETGFPNVVLINGSWGYGDAVVQGIVEPDEFVIFKHSLRKGARDPILERRMGSKAVRWVRNSGAGLREAPTPASLRSRFCLEDEEAVRLAGWGLEIEKHYATAMDIEWVRRGDGEMFLVQARPETVHSVRRGMLKTYTFEQPSSVPAPILTGLSVGGAIAHGKVRIVRSARDTGRVGPQDILVTRMTTPDWVPAMRQAAGIITDVGGRTCHAAIVSRELGIPAIVGTGNGTTLLREGAPITVSTAGGETGCVLEGHIPFTIGEVDPTTFVRTSTMLMINLATPDSAFSWWQMPVDGVGLARMEFIITERIGLHPLAALHPDSLSKAELRRWKQMMRPGGLTPREVYVNRLAEGIAKIAASQHPKPVIVRTSDFKSNEYARLLGGHRFEPEEENPMLGWRGASRYLTEEFREAFALECEAIKRVREDIGLENVIVMIPFCRTPSEAESVSNIMENNGLRRGRHGLKIYMMCEIPSNVLRLEDFDPWFDGYSIGSNDLTQLLLGVDRDSARLAGLFDENDPSVRLAIRMVIERAKELGKPIGICGQAPSDLPGFARFLVEEGITSMSVNPDSILHVHQQIVDAEFARGTRGTTRQDGRHRNTAHADGRSRNAAHADGPRTPSHSNNTDQGDQHGHTKTQSA